MEWKVGDTAYYKYPDKWGSPIEKCAVIAAYSSGVWVRVETQAGKIVGFVSWQVSKMLRPTAVEAARAARDIRPDDTDGVFREYNARMLAGR